MFISVEGGDRVGKDSLMLALDKKNKWHNCNMMRGPAGCLTYDKVYNRETDQRKREAYSVAEAIKTTKYLVVFLYADEATIKKRLQEEGTDYYAPEPWTIESLQQFYRENVYKLYDAENILCLNSGEMTIEEEIAAIEAKMEEVRNDNLNLCRDINQKNIKSPNAGDFYYCQYLPIRRVFTNEDCKLFAPFDESVDKPYYDMLYATLKHKLYEKKLGWINDRQIIYASYDCIPFTQFIKHDDFTEVFVHQRSCDVEKHKMNDIMFFANFIEKELGTPKFKIYYSCAFPHRYIAGL